MLRLHGGFLTFAMYHQWETVLITLTNNDEIEKRAHDSQIVRAKENLTLRHHGPCYSQASGTNPPIKALRKAVIESEA